MMSAVKIRVPPNIMLIVNFSDKKITEDKIMTTGSKVDTSAVVDAPVFSRPVRNDQKARTVDIIAINRMAIYPTVSLGGVKPANKFIMP